MTELLEENDCYVCMEPTTEVSPCECKAPVHMKCLKSWVKKLDDKRLVCSICHRDLKGMKIVKYSRGNIITRTSSNRHRYRRIDYLTINVCFRWVVFILFGYIGKIIFAFVNGTPELLTYTEYWSPFDFLFIMGAVITLSFCTVMYQFFSTLRNYIRAVCPQQYEEFDNPDSDDDDDYDSVV